MSRDILIFAAPDDEASEALHQQLTEAAVDHRYEVMADERMRQRFCDL